MENNFKKQVISINGKIKNLSQPLIVKAISGENRIFLRDTRKYNFTYVPDYMIETISKNISSVFTHKLIDKKDVTIENILHSIQTFFRSDVVLLPSWKINTAILTGNSVMLDYNGILELFYKKDFKLVKVCMNKKEIKEIIWKFGLLNIQKNNYKKRNLKVVLPGKFVYNLGNYKRVENLNTTFLQALLEMIRSQKFLRPQ